MAKINLLPWRAERRKLRQKEFYGMLGGAALAAVLIGFGVVKYFDDNPELASLANVSSVPTLMAFRDGILLHQSAGALPKAQFEQLLEAVQAVDMDEVKAQVAANEAAG